MAAKTQELWLIRHGETPWSGTWQHTGRTDVPLTEVGRHQAWALSQRLVGRKFGLVLSSPLSRALDTCRLSGVTDHPEVTDDLLEWDYGAAEGRTTKEIRAELGKPDWTIWRDGTPGGETPEQIAVRVSRIIARAEQTEGDVALFAHGHVLRILTATWLGLPPRDGRLFSLSTASISVLGFEHETRVIRGWNRDWHLVLRDGA